MAGFRRSRADAMRVSVGPAGTRSSTAARRAVRKTTSNDNRYELMLYRSPTGAEGWTRNQMLYELAAGYPDMTLLEDGRLAIVFEAGPRRDLPAKGGNRPAGWMRLDVLILPKEVTDYGYWFE